jgi:hypothetical protein
MASFFATMFTEKYIVLAQFFGVLCFMMLAYLTSRYRESNQEEDEY